MKRALVIFWALTLLFCLCLPVCAAEETGEFPYICDTEQLLTEAERFRLETQAETISEQYQCAVYFLTVDDYRYYGNGTIYDVAKSIYMEYDLGWGQEKSGILLMLSMEDRDYALIAYGYGNTAFTDYGKDYLSERFLDDFGDDDWAGGCRDYLKISGEMLEMARAGTPFTARSRVKTWHIVVISLLLGFAAALGVCAYWSKSCKKKTATMRVASGYLDQSGMRITLRDDKYTHTTQTRHKIETSSGSSGGTTIDSDGFSGKSGKF